TNPTGHLCTVTGGVGTIALSDVTVTVNCISSWTVWVDVTGITSGSLTLQNNAGDDIPVSADASYSFATMLNDGATYNVTTTNPTGHLCTVTGGAGTIALSDVTVTVNCISTWTVWVDVTGLAGTFDLQLNGTETINIAADGTYDFATLLTYNTLYTISILNVSTGNYCTISNESGVMGLADITNVQINCIPAWTISGIVTGATPSDSITVQNTVTGETVNSLTDTAGNASFNFTQQTPDNAAYNVIVTIPPTSQSCTVTNSSGIAATDVSNINITCGTSWTLSGNISQATGGTSGDTVYVRIYTDPAEILNYISETTLTVSPGGQATGTYNFTISNGTYYIRAFRDEDFNAKPSYITDPQNPALTVVVAGANSAGNNITLNAALDGQSYMNFNVFTSHESAQAIPPWNSVTQNEGLGLCQGFYLKLEAENMLGTANLNTIQPAVRLPSGIIQSLINDGGCSSNVADNTSQSYDEDSSDSKFTYGFISPGTDKTGDYTLFYRNTADDHIHIEVDNVSAITKLARVRTISPNGSSALSNLSPTISWNSVTGAGSYYLEIRKSSDGTAQTNVTVNTPFFTLASLLVDVTAYRTTVISFDSDITAVSDFDAISTSIENGFITDTTGSNHILISGSLTNNLSGITGDFILQAREESNWTLHSSVITSGTSYSLAMLHTPNLCGAGSDPCGSIIAFIDASGSGERSDNINKDYQKYRAGIDISSGITLIGENFQWNTPVTLLSPTDTATAVGNTPSFSWQDYTPYAPSVWGYILYIQDRDSGNNMPEIIWGLPNTTTSLDLASLPVGKEKYDVACLANGGVWDGTVCSGGTGGNLADLSSGINWEWGVIIVECEYNDFAADNPAASPADNYTQCLIPLLSGGNFYSESPNWRFNP
ncbi:MAG: hypothetical protein OEZ22_13205, partial [Spirochaetia bacterium]|nr:hypothetical protein [Spirochaetia bacterium]